MRVLIKTTYELLRDPFITKVGSGTIVHKIEYGDMVVDKQKDLCGKVVFCFTRHAGGDTLYATGEESKIYLRQLWIVHPWMIKKVLVE